ncbi:MAG: D-glycero-beta-D-manno-heptose 1,7-bisphosphate 7-phosphatase [Thermodesulfobacteriota bacterium]
MTQRVVFLDRDGVINEDRADYVKTVDEFKLLPGSAEAVRLLNENGFDVMIITNQSVINRGMVSREVLSDIHRTMIKAVAAKGGDFRDIFFCPHRPDEKCGCRKPAPGMILAAKEKHGVDLSRSAMVGDNVKDMLVANRAGVGTAVLVRTGSGREAEAEYAAKGARVDHVADDLAAAARWIVANRREG